MFSDCPQPVNVLVIVLPIVIGIVLAGLIALIVWKIYQTIRDKREWVNFENEMKKSKWTKVRDLWYLIFCLFCYRTLCLCFAIERILLQAPIHG